MATSGETYAKSLFLTDEQAKNGFYFLLGYMEGNEQFERALETYIQLLKAAEEVE